MEILPEQCVYFWIATYARFFWYIEELEEQINALKEELKIQKQQAYESSREARNYQQRYETLAQVTANEAQELHDLRELIFRQQDGSYESL